MSTGLPRRFDPQRLAVQGSGPEGGTLAGTLDTGMMPRLAAMLATDDVLPVAFEIRAFRDDSRRLLLEGGVDANLVCHCQRCMEPVTLPVRSQIALAVVADEDAVRNLPAELEPLLLDSETEVDLPALIEDELILALPPIPVHENIEDCGERVKYGRQADEAFDGGAKRESPFAVLKKLKNGND